MKVVVTGGTGFLGANLVRKLLVRGDEVHCIVRKPNICLQGLDVVIHQQPLGEDRASIERLARIMDGAEIVYHLAGIFDPSPGGVDRMINLHVLATRGLLRASEKAGVRRFLYCSSSITVGYGERDDLGNEDTYFNPAMAYGESGALIGYYRSKKQGEELVLGWRNIETVVVNPDYIIGPWDIKPTSGQLIVAMARGRLPLYPKGGKCFMTASDCIDGHIAAALTGRAGERYLLGGENLSYSEFLGIVSKVVGKRPPRFAAPNIAFKMTGWLGEKLAKVDAHRFAGLDANVLRAMQENRFRSADKMRDELGIHPEPISNGVERAFKWFVEHDYC